MFLIGETTGKVSGGKLELPKEYHLKKREVLGKWKENVLYMSDSEKSLNYAAGRDNSIVQLHVDAYNKIHISGEYENSNAVIIGCVTTVQIKFYNQQEVV